MKITRTTTSYLALCLYAAVSAYGQVSAGSLGGAITDPSGAGVPGAKIVASNPATGSNIETVSSEAGLYVFPALPPAVYTISAEKAGFKKMNRQNVEVRIAQRLDLNLSMEVGDVSQAVEVTAELPVLETSTSERGTNLSQKFLMDLPLFTGGIRNLRSFVSYLPGVSAGSGEMSVSGSGGRAQEVLLDGASMTIPESGGTVFNFPAADMFQEFKMVQSTFAAEYGRFGGGVELYTTRSGTNWYHGSAFWNIRRDVFNANSWANNSRGIARAKERFNEQGGAVGGPVWIPKVYNKDRNKTFFYFTYTRDGRPASIIGTPVNTVPTAAMKTGNFAGAATIYDPATTSGSTRQPFPNNAIPSSRFSRVASNVLPLIPNPTRPTLAANYDFISTQIYSQYIWSLKFDHAITDNNRVSFFMSRETQETDQIVNFTGPLGHGLVNGQKPYNYRVNHDWNIKPTLLMHSTFGFTAQRQTWDNPNQNGFASKIGIPGLPAAADAFPRIFWTGRAGLTNWGVQDGKVANGGQNNDTWMATQSFSWLKGKHEFKFGWDARWLGTLGFDNAASNGRYFFNSAQTALPTALTTTGHEFASFLLGAVDQADSVVLPALFDPVRYRYAAGYFQDNWRVASKLTLNLGLRYEVPIGWHIPAGYSYVDLSKPNPAANNLPGAYSYAGKGAGRTGLTRPYPTDFTNIGPRFGFAYQPLSKTVIRGGFGIYYQTLGNGGCGCREGFAGTNTVQSDGVNPVINIDGGVPVSPFYAPPPNLNPSALNFQNASYFGPTFGNAPRVYNWSFEIQQEIKGFLFDISYQGNRGTRLSSTVDLNQLPVSQLSKGTLLQQSITSAAAQQANVTAPFAGFGNRSVAQSLRPFPQYLSVYSRNAGVGRSWYDSLQTKFEKRFGTWQLLANHTWSKSLGVAHFRQIFTQLGTAVPQDYYNINDAKSYMPFDQTHILNIINTIDLPFGKGRKFLGNTNAAVDRLVSGWTVSTIQRYTSGNLIQAVTPGNPLGNGVLFAGVTKANRTSTAIQTGIDRGTLDPNNPASRWFNPGAYSAAPNFTLGTAAFFDDQFRQPPTLNENFGLQKRTVIVATDKNPVVLLIRMDAFNLFNRTAFGGVVGVVGNANFGRPTGPQVGARLITMGARIEF